MAKSPTKYEPPLPGPLRLRDSVRAALFSLRHFTDVCLSDMTPPRHLRAPELDVQLVEDVERALKCRLPDEILACLANDDFELSEYGFVLGQVVDNAQMARAHRCPKDLVAVGQRPDSDTFYCVSRSRLRERSVQLADLDILDGSVDWYDLGTWLSNVVERRQESLAEHYSTQAGWKPSPAELANFKPCLIEANA